MREAEKNNRWIQFVPGKLPQVCIAEKWVADGERARHVGQVCVDRGQGRGGQREKKMTDKTERRAN